jgi:hypothetical protein
VVFDAGIDGLPEDGLQVDASGSIDELTRARIFKPVLRRLHGVGLDSLRARGAGGCNYGFQDAGAGCVTAAGWEQFLQIRSRSRNMIVMLLDQRLACSGVGQALLKVHAHRSVLTGSHRTPNSGFCPDHPALHRL